MEQLQNVPFGNVMGMVFSLAVAFGLPAGLFLYLWRKKKASPLSFVVGMAVFVLFALVLESSVHSVVFSLTGTLLTGNLFLYALYGALMAAAFEETGRYLAFRFLLRNRLTRENALMYGAGHGGVEAMVLLGITSINNLANSVLVNNGSMTGVLATLDETTRQTVTANLSTLWETPAYLFFIAGFERIVAVCLHVALSVLVYRAVRDGKARWYWAAFGAHFAVDFAAVLLPNVSIFFTEAAFVLMTAAAVWYAAKVYRETE